MPDTATLNAAALFVYKTGRILCSRMCACNHIGKTELSTLVNELFAGKCWLSTEKYYLEL